MIVIGKQCNSFPVCRCSRERPVTHNRIQTSNYFLDESINCLVYYVSADSEDYYVLEYEGTT